MHAEFLVLSEKVERLAALALALRGENAELRAQCAELSARSRDLEHRMQEAQQRVLLLIDKLPRNDEQEPETA